MGYYILPSVERQLANTDAVRIFSSFFCAELLRKERVSESAPTEAGTK